MNKAEEQKKITAKTPRTPRKALVTEDAEESRKDTEEGVGRPLR
jgi:hypothetical protein